MQQPLKDAMLIELSVQGQFEMSNCVLGQIEIKSHLCHSEDYNTGNKLIKTYLSCSKVCACAWSTQSRERQVNMDFKFIN